jgi:hypothetical protein
MPFCGHLLHIFPVLVFCTKNNLATLRHRTITLQSGKKENRFDLPLIQNSVPAQKLFNGDNESAVFAADAILA